MSKRILVHVFAACLLFWAAGCATMPSTPEGSSDLKTLCEQYNVQWNVDSVSHAINLRSFGREASALVGSSIVLVSGEKVYLSDVVKREGGSVIVPPDFVTKVIARLTGGVSIRPGYHILVDAGHGGKDPGAISRNGTQEKDIVIDIARRLRTALQEKGFKVTMTRDRDEFITLEERTAIATRAKADLFVSIHANSSPSRGVDGLEVYALRELEGIEKRDIQRLKNQKTMFRNLSMQNGNAQVEAIVADMLFNYKITDSQLLAAYVNKGASLAASTSSRGVKRAGFHVLRNTLIPAVLVEVGYLTNLSEETKLRQPEYRQKLAEGIATGLAGFATR